MRQWAVCRPLIQAKTSEVFKNSEVKHRTGHYRDLMRVYHDDNSNKNANKV